MKIGACLVRKNFYDIVRANDMKNSWIKKKTVYVPTIAIVIVVMLFIYQSGKQAPRTVEVEVKRENLIQEVTVSGTVKAKQAVELAFEKSGRIKKINFDVGDKIEPGAVLISLENSVEASSVDDAEAKLLSKQAHYDDLKRGGRPEEVKLKETGLAKAESDLAADYSAIPNIMLDVFNKTDNAVHRQADILFSNQFSANPQLNFNSADQQAALDAQNPRFVAEGTLNNFKKLIQDPSTNYIKAENDLAQAKNFLQTINDFLIKTNHALNAALNLSDSALTADKDALNTARTNINTALTKITDQIQTIAAQKISVETAKNELELIKVGATEEVLSGALADIKSAEATVKNAKAVFAKTILISPIYGVVTKQEGKIGEIAAANAEVIAIMSGNFKVETFVPEIDVAKIALGNPSTITLDAYGSSLIFSAHVVKIDPAETVIDSVSTYKTTLEFDKDDPKIRSGMTANITIESARRENVLSLPQRAVYEKDGKKFVRVSKGKNSSEEREVTIGIRGSNGNIEIASGLEEKERVFASGK